jgi:hypothetical protein
MERLSGQETVVSPRAGLIHCNVMVVVVVFNLRKCYPGCMGWTHEYTLSLLVLEINIRKQSFTLVVPWPTISLLSRAAVTHVV